MGAGFGLLCMDSSKARAEDQKGTVVDLDGLRSAAPAEWKSEEPGNRMRHMQFRLPKVKDDKADAELIIFKGLGGSARDNIKRWQAQFIPPKGKSIDDVSKVMEMKIGQAEASYLDINGTYLFKERPADPNSKTERRPDYRMLALHMDGPKNIYHIKLVGPAKTVEHYKTGFDEWLKAFK
jgi:hypothetical protein